MRRSVALLLLFFGVMSAACGQSASPISPTATEGSLRRIVQDVSGGNVGTCSNPAVCSAIQGDVSLTSNAGTLATAYPGTGVSTSQKISEPREFDVLAGLMTATGRLADRGLAWFALEVTPQTATVWVNLNATNGSYLQATGSATPEFNVTADASCTSGQRLYTTMALHLPFLGQTDIVDNHCIR
jgi:hypothetical protein